MGLGEDLYYDLISIYKPIFGNYRNYIKWWNQRAHNNIIIMIRSLEAPEIYRGVL